MKKILTADDAIHRFETETLPKFASEFGSVDGLPLPPQINPLESNDSCEFAIGYDLNGFAELPDDEHFADNTNLTHQIIRQRFGFRLSASSDALRRLEKISTTDGPVLDDLLVKLRRTLEKMEESDEREFLDQDVRFHQLITQFADEKKTMAGYAHETIYLVGDLDENSRQLIIDEHTGIYEALLVRDFNQAQRLMYEHLRKAMARWLPNIVSSIHLNNLEFFDRMLSESFLLWTGTIVPLEWTSRNLQTALAKALRRGAKFFYLFAFGSALEESGNGLATRQSDIMNEFSDFREQTISALQELESSMSTTEAKRMFDESICLGFADNELLFTLNRPNQSFGLFYFAPGDTQLTERVAVDDGVPSNEIEEVSQPSMLLRDLFLKVVVRSIRNSLSDMAGNKCQWPRLIDLLMQHGPVNSQTHASADMQN